MKKWNRTTKIWAGLIILFLVSQAVQPQLNNGVATGPGDITQVVGVPDSVMAVLKRSCYDCHSDHTAYPWYDRITPVNWWITHHINEGKRELNFTMFADYTPRRKAKKLEEIAETVEEGEMPLKSYLIMHGDAELTESQRESLISWAKGAQKALTANRQP